MWGQAVQHQRLFYYTLEINNMDRNECSSGPFTPKDEDQIHYFINMYCWKSYFVDPDHPNLEVS